MRRLGLAALLLAAALSTFALLPPVDSRSDGSGLTAAEGCTCHAPQASPFVTVTVVGLPERFEGGERYSLLVSITGAPPPLPVAQNQGGFALDASAGTLLVPDGAQEVRSSGATATHTEAGNDQRVWAVEWTAPAAGGGVTIVAASNAVNGDGVNDPLDLWGTVSVEITGNPARPEPRPSGGNVTPPEVNGSQAPPPEAMRTPLPGAALAAAGLSLAAASRRTRS